MTDRSTKVYRHWSGDSSLLGMTFANGYDPPPVAFTAQVKIKVTEFFLNSNPHFLISMVGFCYGRNIECYYSPYDCGKRGLFLSDRFINCPYFAFRPFDLEINRWYYFKMGQSDTVNQQPAQIYFKVWPEGEEEPANWVIHPGPGGHYLVSNYRNIGVSMPDSICWHYLGFLADATYANFDEIEVYSGLEGVEDYDPRSVIPKVFELYQNYPNPFNVSTMVRYSIPDRDIERRPYHITLKIYNILGQEVRTLVDQEQPTGDYRVLWDGRDNSGKDVSSGVYFCRLKTGKFTRARKMILLR